MPRENRGSKTKTADDCIHQDWGDNGGKRQNPGETEHLLYDSHKCIADIIGGKYVSSKFNVHSCEWCCNSVFSYPTFELLLLYQFLCKTTAQCTCLVYPSTHAISSCTETNISYNSQFFYCSARGHRHRAEK